MRKRDRDRETESERTRVRETDRETEKERNRERNRETEKQRETDRTSPPYTQNTHAPAYSRKHTYAIQTHDRTHKYTYMHTFIHACAYTLLYIHRSIIIKPAQSTVKIAVKTNAQNPSCLRKHHDNRSCQ